MTALPATAGGRHHGQGHKAQGHVVKKVANHRTAKRYHQRRYNEHRSHGYFSRFGHRYAQRKHWIGHGQRHNHHRSRVDFHCGYVAPAPTYYVARVGQAPEHAGDGETIRWNSPDDGTRYELTPKRPVQTAAGRYCREYQKTATIGGRPQETYGTACRQPDGSWQFVQ